MRRLKKRRIKLFIVSNLLLLLFLCAGYAAFRTSLNLKAKGNVVILEDLYVASYGSDTTGNGTISRPFATIQKAYDRAGNNASIHLLDNITQKETINFDKNKEITLDSVNNNSLIRDYSLTDYLLMITNGTTTFKNITFDGNNVICNVSMIYIDSNAIIESGSIFKNAYNNESGGAIFLAGNTLLMNGGEIYNNTNKKGGAAIFVYGCHDTQFIFQDGAIHDNNSQDGAIWSNGTITINGGKIYNNISKKEVRSGGAGAIFNNGILTINGGEIYNNESVYGGAIVCGSSICSPTYAELRITKGKIYNNKAESTAGGIQLSKNTIYSNTGGVIENNTPDNVYRVS